jgi:hypothetical protein
VKIAHIINPLVVEKSSELFNAQPITFKTMRRAQKFAEPDVEVELFTAQYPEDKSIIPAGFKQTPNLDRSVLDVIEFHTSRKLPLLRDILSRLYETSKADYFIYTNVDIALQPQFYCVVNEFIRQGYDSFVINRRTISADFSSLEDLDLMYDSPGKQHRGWDCFIFPRQFFPHFKLFDVCVGADHVGLALLANLVALSQRFWEFRDEYLTFHIGDSRSWLKSEHKDYDEHNALQVMRILSTLEEEHGPFPRKSIPGSFLFRMRTFGQFYIAWTRRVYLPAGLSRFINRIAGRL